MKIVGRCFIYYYSYFFLLNRDVPDLKDLNSGSTGDLSHSSLLESRLEKTSNLNIETWHHPEATCLPTNVKLN